MSAPEKLWVYPIPGKGLYGASTTRNDDASPPDVLYVRVPTAPQGAEPVAFVWHGTSGEGTKSLRWSKPSQWEYAESVQPLYAAPQGAEIARDAARYRCLRPMLKTHFAILFKNVSDDEIDAAIDAVLTPTDAETKG